MIVTHLGALRGLPAFDFPNPAASGGALPDADAVAWRISVEPCADDAEEFTDAWARFVATVDLSAVQALIIGQWGESYEADSSSIVELIVAQQERLTSLRAVFLADITTEEQEISWIQQSDVTPILATFPRLVELGIRGGTDLQFPPTGHGCLRRLTVESGGLPVDVVRGISSSEFPALEFLELWLGDDGYGGDATAEDLSDLLSGEALPSLKHLGLRNSEIQDAVVHAVVAAPLLARLRTLDLSLGVLTDDGAAALLASRRFAHLDSLDLHHHFLSDAVVADLTQHCAELAVHVDLSEQMSPDASDGEVWRCIAVTE